MGNSSQRKVAAQELDKLYTRRLQSLVRALLDERYRQKRGTDAVVQDVWNSFYRKVLPLSAADGDLWPLLAKIARRRVCKTVREYSTKKRCLDHERQVSVNEESEHSEWHSSLEARDPTPTEAAMVIECLESLSPRHQAVVALRFEGLSDLEIGTRLAEQENRTKPYSEKTIQRDFADIRKHMETWFDVR